MKTIALNTKGFSLLELMMGVLILSAISSIALPRFSTSMERARSAKCTANRYHIELVERDYYLQHNKAGLQMDASMACPSGGVYVWLAADPKGSKYPLTGCSIHGSTYALSAIITPASAPPAIISTEGSVTEEPATPKDLSPKDENLVASWGMDEGSGNTFGIGSMTGQISGAEWVDGKLGKGLKLDGNSKDTVTIGPAGEVQLAGSMYLSMWVKLDDMPGSDNNTLFTCTASGEKESGNILYSLQLDKNGNLSYLHEYDNGKNQSSKFTSTGITAGSWTQIGLSRDIDKKTVDVYVNGTNVGSYAYKNDPTGGSDTKLYLGSDLPNQKRSIAGVIDEVGIYDRPFTPEEIQAGYEKMK